MIPYIILHKKPVQSTQATAIYQHQLDHDETVNQLRQELVWLSYGGHKQSRPIRRSKRGRNVTPYATMQYAYGHWTIGHAPPQQFSKIR